MVLAPTLTVRQVVLGGPSTAVIVPVTSPDVPSLTADVTRAVHAGADIVEWRVDHLRECDPAAVVDVAALVRAAAGPVPVLATVRTATEGGEVEVDDAGYLALVRALLDSGEVDLVDVELRRGCVEEAVALAGAADVPVVASAHHFEGTPPVPVMLGHLEAMERLGAAVAKVAVMPRTRLDVVALLAALAQRVEVARIPLIGIAMGELGAVTRVAGAAFGSCATFATLDSGLASAPGQLPLSAVRTALHVLDPVSTFPPQAT